MATAEWWAELGREYESGEEAWEDYDSDDGVKQRYDDSVTATFEAGIESASPEHANVSGSNLGTGGVALAEGPPKSAAQIHVQLGTAVTAHSSDVLLEDLGAGGDERFQRTTRLDQACLSPDGKSREIGSQVARETVEQRQTKQLREAPLYDSSSSHFLNLGAMRQAGPATLVHPELQLEQMSVRILQVEALVMSGYCMFSSAVPRKHTSFTCECAQSNRLTLVAGVVSFIEACCPKPLSPQEALYTTEVRLQELQHWKVNTAAQLQGTTGLQRACHVWCNLVANLRLLACRGHAEQPKKGHNAASGTLLLCERLYSARVLIQVPECVRACDADVTAETACAGDAERDTQKTVARTSQW
eukprot:6202243-Pleurochrysis_carterae.AAC.1